MLEANPPPGIVRAMRRPLVTLAAAVTLGLPLAACGGSDDGASGCSPADAELAVGAEDSLKFDEERYEAEAGCIEVTYTNNGSQTHTLLIKEQSGFKLSVGDTDTGTVDLPAGDYKLFCDVPTHESGGMIADLTVS